MNSNIDNCAIYELDLWRDDNVVTRHAVKESLYNCGLDKQVNVIVIKLHGSAGPYFPYVRLTRPANIIRQWIKDQYEQNNTLSDSTIDDFYRVNDK